MRLAANNPPRRPPDRHAAALAIASCRRFVRQWAIGVCALIIAWSASSAEAAQPLLGLPPRVAVADDTPALVAVGEQLFRDVRLSAKGDRSCATCHQADRALTDGRSTAEGTRHVALTRNTPSLYNVAYLKDLFWDGRVNDLVEQATVPLTSSLEHGLASDAEIARAVQQDPILAAALSLAAGVPANALTGRHVRLAIAAYERTLLAGDSAADRYLFAHDASALSPAAIRGLKLFQGRAECATCHSIGADDALYTDGRFHSGPDALPQRTLERLPAITARVDALVGRGALTELNDWIDTDAAVAALGRYLATRTPADIGRFRTPSLRNVALTAPYFHDGRVATLAQAIDAELYSRSDARAPIVLTITERQDLLAFLEALSSPVESAHETP